MISNEIFGAMSPAAADGIFNSLRDNQKGVVATAIDSLAQQKKLRAVFIQRKPRTEQHAWLKESLARRQNTEIAGNILQLWLTSAHRDMLILFLDRIGVAHDGEGMIESESPAAPSEASLREGVEALLAAYPPETVAIYLRMFLNGFEGWHALAAIVDADSRLRLGV